MKNKQTYTLYGKLQTFGDEPFLVKYARNRKEAEEADYRYEQRVAEQDKKDREKRLEEEALRMAKERLADKKSGRQTMEGEFDFNRLSTVEQHFIGALHSWVHKRKIRLEKERQQREMRANPIGLYDDDDWKEAHKEPEEPEGSWADLLHLKEEEDDTPEDSWGDLIYEACQYK